MIYLPPDIDQTAEAYWDRMGGMSKQERVDMAELMKEDDAFEGFVDVWRNLHPEAEEYTYVFCRTSARPCNTLCVYPSGIQVPNSAHGDLVHS